ncbi:MAG TPA: MMPL family transporter [Segeticoccus sp.]|uniref:MMPL family transporter n=1 Tax=Segeticoccus sp. TaxID=2706531 RepID=UPI002D7EDC64|nr:MMPL family transporter [Segeticoccus sp.]HET8601193.1 MMPL family transporter [Segeticoccus sp.]
MWSSRGSHRRTTRFRWALPAVLVAVWLLVGGVTGPLAGKLSTVQTNDAAAFLPASAEATQVARLQKKFNDQQTVPAVVVYADPSGLDAAVTQRARADADAIAGFDGVAAPVAGPVPSRDGKALELIVPIRADSDVAGVVDRVRARVSAGLPEGARGYVTGPAGFTADLTAAFAGIDGILLLVAVLVVLVILVLVYRSPVLPFAVLISSLFALAVASGLVYLLADRDLITLNGQSQGILFILVVGAATDYALLLTSRYREELREHESRFAAMAVAWRQSLPTVLASGLTVMAGLLCLLLSDLNSTSSLGPVGALGILGALLSTLTFLPAVLVLLGRAAFWPRRPRFGSPHPERSGVWGAVARFVGRRPRALWVGTGAGLVVLAAFVPTLQAGGTSQDALFLHQVPSVTGQQVAARHFPAGTGSPAVIIGPADRVTETVAAAKQVPGVSQARPVGPTGGPVKPGQEPASVDGLAQVQATLEAPPDSERAIDTVRALRDTVHDAVPGARVGGSTATTLDTRTTAEHDRNLVIPIVLVVIFVLLALLLRALLAPLLLLVTVVLSFAATLGVSALVFNHLFGFAGADPSVPLFGFVFLVALGVDYNIFLMSRVREESGRHGTRDGVLRGLAVTGGVITSAGVVLAATFAALSVIPLLFLAQIAFIVAFGVLLDTVVVRSLLVPALVHDLGSRVWWPSRLASKE